MAKPPHDPEPTDDWFPLEPEEHERQLAGLLRRLGQPAKRVMDIGAGSGRIALPLADAGHLVLAVDRDPCAVEACGGRGPRLTARLGDALAPAADLTLPFESGPGRACGYDAALCLGNTFALFHEPHAAVGLMRRLRGVVRPQSEGGFFAIDDMCGALWREVAEGNWQNGVSEDGRMQLVWGEADNVLAIRHGGSVDPECWRVREPDRPVRLWSMGDLALLCEASGWNPPLRAPADHLIVFTHPG